ncbi:Protein ENHANCED DISEASE RESISTANCE 2 [Linum perenne]
MEVVPVEQEEKVMEGWMYVLRHNRIGLQYSTKRYFILQDHLLKSFKSLPASKDQDPLRSAIIDSCIRVTENGRETVNRKVLFVFTLFNTSNHNDQLKLGATSPEEAAKWIHLFQEAALKGNHNVVGSSRSTWQSFRLTESRRVRQCRSIDWTLCSTSTTHTDPVNDVIAPSSWTIFGCQNGLRLFKETKDRDSHGKWDDHPAIMAVGVVDGASESIFQTLMSLGPTRSEWDFCFYKGSVVEHLDGHTDIVHKQLYNDWLSWGMKRRDFLLRRYWRREDDGTYVILYHSVFHKKCPPQKGYVRACLKSNIPYQLSVEYVPSPCFNNLNTLVGGGYVISPLSQALRELFRAKLGACTAPDFSSGELAGSALNRAVVDVETYDAQVETDEDVKAIVCQNEEADKAPSEHASIGGLNDAADEFFDVPEPSDNECWSYDFGSEACSQDIRQPKLSSAAVFVKKLHDLAVQKRGYVDLHDMSREDNISCGGYGTTLPKDESCSLLSSWAMTDPSTFLIRGKNYLHDQKKIKAKGTLMQMVAADWLKSDKREDDLAGRPGSIVQKYAAQGGPEFFLIINIQVPGSTTYSLALYFMMNTPLEDSPLLQSFVDGDDAFRNSRFKLIPYISKGSWIVKQSVGKKACLIGQALEMNYFRGKNYLELGVDIGSSTVARGVVSLVLGYLSNLVIEMAFLVQADTDEELPEYLLGTCRLNHLDASKAVSLKQ